MTQSFECIDDFMKALEEVDILLNCAMAKEISTEEYSIFNKSGLLFLTAKFEAFLENLISEYTFILDNLAVCPSKLSNDIKLRSVNYLLDKNAISKLRALNPSALALFEMITKILKSDKNPPSFSDIINKKFSYGKHGEKEILKLFQGVGVDNIFEKCKVPDLSESMEENGSTKKFIDIRANINSMVGLRNSIIHEDATPSLTHYQIAQFKENLVNFANELIKELNRSAKELQVQETG